MALEFDVALSPSPPGEIEPMCHCMMRDSVELPESSQWRS